MRSVAIRLHNSESDAAVVVLLLPDITQYFTATLLGALDDHVQLLHLEGHILGAVAVRDQVLAERLVRRIVR